MLYAMNRDPSPLAALFPDVRRRILETLMLEPDRWWYLSDLAAHLGLRPSSLQRELANLSAAGILERRRDGNRVYYRPHPECPYKAELEGLFLKTAGVEACIAAMLAPYDEDIMFAFVYGSLARGEVEATSDVDLMIIGGVRLATLARPLREAEKSLSRAIHPVVFSWEEFAEKVKQGNHFVTTVLKGDKVFAQGSEDELAKAVERAAR